MKHNNLLIIICLYLLISCTEESQNATPIQNSLPTVLTSEVKAISDIDAISGGNVTSDAGFSVTQRGVCWSKNASPTINDSKTINGQGGGIFESKIESLTPNTTYFIRAYATNSNGTAYGISFTFTTKQELQIATKPLTNITAKNATSGGTIIANGKSIIERGVCYSKLANPTYSDSKTEDGVGDGTYTSNLTNLEPSTKYYIRSYAKTSDGIIYYGENLSFVTNSQIEFAAVLNLEFSINETATNPSGKDYSHSKMLTASSDPEIAKYANKIEGFIINRITYTISPGANPNTVTFTNSALKAVGKTLATISSASLSNTAETELTSDATGFNELATKLLGDLQEEVTVTGRLSSTPVTFTVTFKFYVTVQRRE